MPSNVTSEPDIPSFQTRYQETALERNGLKLETGAPVTVAVLTGVYVVAGFGDGTVRFFHPELPPIEVQAHEGVVLSMVADCQADNVLTGGDDGRFLKVSPHGKIEEIANFGTRWVDCVAAGPEGYACSSGRVAYLWAAGEEKARPLEHPSTVGGLAFDERGTKVAVAHYGGATIWEHNKRRWKAKKMVWKGSHGAISFSPDGKYVVTTMQENALHSWRLRDKKDMAMSGYPAKVKSFVWVGDEPYLATSGADEAIGWSFAGKDGPLGRTADTCAHGGNQPCTAVAGLLGVSGVFAGFADGSVVAGKFDSDYTDLMIKRGGGAPVTALAVSPEGWILVGEESGDLLWGNLRGGAH